MCSSGANMDNYTDEIHFTSICKISIPIIICYIYSDVSVIVGGEQGGQQGTDPAWQAYYAQYYGQYQQQQQQQGGQPGQPAQSAAPTSQANPATPAATAAAGGQAAGGQPSQYIQEVEKFTNFFMRNASIDTYIIIHLSGLDYC